MTLITDQLELGWRFDPDEPRDAHGQWTRGGKGYIAPDHERLILPHAPKNTRWPYYRAPEDHPFFRAHPVSAANIVASYDASSEQEREQGMRWYADAGLLARAIAHGDAAKGAGLLASYSPQAPWPANMFNAARSMELGHAIGHEAGMITGSMQDHAQRILDGEPNDKVFGKNSAPKIRAFAHLIEHGGDDPGEQLGNVVIDRHAMSVATGTRLPKKEADAAPIGTDRYYQHVADQYRLAALEISRRGTPVTPHQVQAITWLHQQSANAAEDETGAEIHGGKGAGHGRQVMQRNAWTRWNTAAQTQHLPVHQGTTALAGLITSQLDLTGDGHGHHIPGTPYVYRHGWKPASQFDVRRSRGIERMKVGATAQGHGREAEGHYQSLLPLSPSPALDLWPANLDASEFQAMADYVSVRGSAAINGALRSGGTLEGARAGEVEAMDGIISRHVMLRDGTVYRGMAMTPKWTARLKPGAVFSDLGYTSTTVDPEKARAFAQWRSKGNDQAVPAIMEITVPAGSNAAPGMPKLSEYVMPRGTRYRVDSVSADGTRYKVTMLS